MTVALLVGAGTVGARAARQLLDSRGMTGLMVADADAERARRLAEAAAPNSRAVSWSPDDPVPPEVGVVVCAAPGDVEVRAATRAVESAVPAVTSSGDAEAVARLFELDEAAVETGVPVLVGAGLAPGLSDVLARYAADRLDSVDEVHVASYGVGGPSCARERRRAARRRPREVRQGAWRHGGWGARRRQVWFPGPVGPQECRAVDGGQVPLLAGAFPGVSRVALRVALRRSDLVVGGSSRGWWPVSAKRADDGAGGLGAVHVEVRGRRARERAVLVYGAVDRLAVACGAVLATAAAYVVGPAPPAPGVLGLAASVEAVPFLRELAARGVRAAAFGEEDAGYAAHDAGRR